VSFSGAADLESLDAARARGTFMAAIGRRQDMVSGGFEAPCCGEIEFTTSGARPAGCP
jgi:hypothetical protein